MSNVQRLTLIIDSLPDGGFIIIDHTTNTPRLAISSSNELLGVVQRELAGFTACNPGDIPHGVRPVARELMEVPQMPPPQPGVVARIARFGGRHG